MMDEDTIAAYRRICVSSRLAWSKSRRPPGSGAVLHSSNELGEPPQWLCYDQSTIHKHCHVYYYIRPVFSIRTFSRLHSEFVRCTPLNPTDIHHSIGLRIRNFLSPTGWVKLPQILSTPTTADADTVARASVLACLCSSLYAYHKFCKSLYVCTPTANTPRNKKKQNIYTPLLVL